MCWETRKRQEKYQWFFDQDELMVLETLGMPIWTDSPMQILLFPLFYNARSGVYTKLPRLERLMRRKSWNVASSLPCAKQEKYFISFGWSIIFVVSAKQTRTIFSVQVVVLNSTSAAKQQQTRNQSRRRKWERAITPVSFLEPPQVPTRMVEQM